MLEVEKNQIRKRDVYNFMLRLGVSVKQSDLGLVSSSECANEIEGNNPTTNSNSNHHHPPDSKHPYSGHTTLKHTHSPTMNNPYPNLNPNPNFPKSNKFTIHPNSIVGGNKKKQRMPKRMQQQRS